MLDATVSARDVAQQPMSATHTHLGTRAVQRMVEHAPGTGGLALWVQHAHAAPDAAGATPQATTAGAPVWTDGLTLHYRPAFAQLSLPRQTGWVAHAVLHIALRHAARYQALQARRGHADLQLFNVCADAIVNSALAHLGWLQLPPHAVHLHTLLAQALGRQQTDETALLEWDVERLYLAVDDRQPPAQAGGARSSANGENPDRSGGGAGGFSSNNRGSPDTRAGPALQDGPRAARTRALARTDAADLAPGAAGSGAPENEADDARTWSERLLRAHAGDGAQSMLRTLLADLPRLRTPWELVLRTQLTHALAQQPALSWSRPARSWLANQGRSTSGRRLPWQPGISATRPVPRLVVVVDVSGSIDAPLLQRFAGEIEALSRRLEAALVVVAGDESVQQVHQVEPGRSQLRELQCRGGGGTDFTPLLEEAQRHRPNVIVVLTDLDGPVRFQPRCRVIWAVPDHCRHAVPPFGRLLVLH